MFIALYFHTVVDPDGSQQLGEEEEPISGETKKKRKRKKGGGGGGGDTQPLITNPTGTITTCTHAHTIFAK